MKPRVRVLLAKTGLDGHDRGLKVIARTLRDLGHEVVYLGRRQTPEVIAQVALDEDVDVVGMSVLSGMHRQVATDVLAALDERDVECGLVIGGTILHREIDSLKEMGVDAVFPVATKLEVIETYFSELAASKKVGGNV